MSNMSRVKGCKVIIDRFQKKLFKWKVSTLSIGGRSMLIKIVLRSLGILMPVRIGKILEVACANFFGGRDEDNRKMSWIKWDAVLADRKHGGLYIGSLVAFNFHLIQK